MIIILPIVSNPAILSVLFFSGLIFFVLLYTLAKEFPIFKNHLIVAFILFCVIILSAIFNKNNPALFDSIITLSIVLFILVLSSSILYFISFLFKKENNFPFVGCWLVCGVISFDFVIFNIMSGFKMLDVKNNSVSAIFTLWFVFGFFSGIFWTTLSLVRDILVAIYNRFFK